MAKVCRLDIEFYDKEPPEGGHKGYVWEQGYFLVHGSDDVLWTDDLETAIEYLAEEIEQVGEALIAGVYNLGEAEADKMEKAVEEEMIERGILVSPHAKEVFDAWEKNGMLDELKKRLNKDVDAAAARSVGWETEETMYGKLRTAMDGKYAVRVEWQTGVVQTGVITCLGNSYLRIERPSGYGYAPIDSVIRVERAVETETEKDTPKGDWCSLCCGMGRTAVRADFRFRVEGDRKLPIYVESDDPCPHCDGTGIEPEAEVEETFRDKLKAAMDGKYAVRVDWRSGDVETGVITVIGEKLFNMHGYAHGIAGIVSVTTVEEQIEQPEGDKPEETDLPITGGGWHWMMCKFADVPAHEWRVWTDKADQYGDIVAKGILRLEDAKAIAALRDLLRAGARTVNSCGSVPNRAKAIHDLHKALVKAGVYEEAVASDPKDFC